MVTLLFGSPCVVRRRPLRAASGAFEPRESGPSGSGPVRLPPPGNPDPGGAERRGLRAQRPSAPPPPSSGSTRIPAPSPVVQWPSFVALAELARPRSRRVRRASRREVPGAPRPTSRPPSRARPGTPPRAWPPGAWLARIEPDLSAASARGRPLSGCLARASYPHTWSSSLLLGEDVARVAQKDQQIELLGLRAISFPGRRTRRGRIDSAGRRRRGGRARSPLPTSGDATQHGLQAGHAALVRRRAW